MIVCLGAIAWIFKTGYRLRSWTSGRAHRLFAFRGAAARRARGRGL